MRAEFEYKIDNDLIITVKALKKNANDDCIQLAFFDEDGNELINSLDEDIMEDIEEQAEEALYEMQYESNYED